MNGPKTYWFPAKRRGWGWGFPATWQGRAVLAAFYGLIALGAATLLPHYGNMVFVVYCILLCIVLIAVCWVKGEPPQWRRGGKGSA